MDVFTRVICRESIKIEPAYLNKDVRKTILARLLRKVEGICSQHGFIKHHTIELQKVCPGEVELASLAGNVVYDVYFYADVCNPLVGSVVKATITNINRFGILAEAGHSDNISVLEIIIAKNSVNVQSEINLERCKIGDEVKVEILGKKFELGERKISAIGRVIKDASAKMNKKEKVPEIDLQNDPEDVDDEEVETEDENSEEEAGVDDEEEEEEEEDDTKHGGSDFFSENEGSLFSDDGDVYDDENGVDESASSSDGDVDGVA